jgi:S-formylglutathione hydrolase FrmB
MTAVQPRYLVDGFHAASLENNPAGSPVERFINIYLPPGYYEGPERSYPVIYFLHGHGGNYRKATISDTSDIKKLEGFLPPGLLAQIKLDKMPTYSMLDELILEGKLEPFILVQPDGSLHLNKIDNSTDLISGMPATKGSFYINSPFTGNYEDYIVKDVVRYVESHYRAIAGRERRVIMGESMGGYGAVSLYFRHPDMFCAMAALSPANLTLSHLSWQLHIPIYEKLLGVEAGSAMGDTWMRDILDTIDLVYAHDCPLLPSVRRDAQGNVTGFDSNAAMAWARNDLNNLLNMLPVPSQKASILINCERGDDYGLAPEAVRLHQTLLQRGIAHSYDLYSDPDAALSPHMFGIAYHIIPALQYCLQAL